MSEWIEWKAAARPVAPDTLVDIAWDDGLFSHNQRGQVHYQIELVWG